MADSTRTTAPQTNWLHPIFIDLGDQPVTVLGGGAVAERKIQALVEAGAQVTVISPDVTDVIRRWADAGQLVLERRPYRAGDLHGARLVYAATSVPQVNRAASVEARASGIWFNAVDDPDLCGFISPAIVRRGDVTIAVSTNGRAPALARHIRERLEQELGPAYAEAAARLGELRDRCKAEGRSPSDERDEMDGILAALPQQAVERKTWQPAASQRPTGGKVYLVGAGPGDPELLTVKGRRLLECADTVVYDALVDRALLDLCRPEALRVYVGKRDRRHARPQAEINALLVEQAQAGRIVVRLKGGDPFVFGRGGEEAETLRQSGVPYEIVPGVSAGIAAPAYAGIPLTHREFASELVFLTGHECSASRTPVEWARYAGSRASLVIFMGLHNFSCIAEELLRNGRDPQCPVAIIENGTTGQQRTVVAPLAKAADAAAQAGLQPPALIVVGEVVALREKLRWFEEKATAVSAT